ncbi:hypothetical protein ACU82A_11105 [Bacillus cereus]
MKKSEVLFRNVEEVMSFDPINDIYEYELGPVNYRGGYKTFIFDSHFKSIREGREIDRMSSWFFFTRRA